MTYRGFTEAVPLSLSSMAHITMPLEEGVLDGIKQVLQHTLLSCVNYARAIHPPYNFTFRDLTTSPYAWEPHHNHDTDAVLKDLPTSLTKLGFQHQYHRTAFIYLKNSQSNMQQQQQQQTTTTTTTTTNGNDTDTKEEETTTATTTFHMLSREEELELLSSSASSSWTETQVNILGRISLLYATTALMTPGELNGTEKDDDTPKCVLYKVLVEYRSLPATGNKAAVQAEELSMLSFGGSVDDDVKYGALAALYDTHAKYVLEIYSVRGKKYKFDLMDSTLSDGTVPRLPSRNSGGSGNRTASDDGAGGGKNGSVTNQSSSNQDPFVKSLCVTVTDHITTDPLPPLPATSTIAALSTTETTETTTTEDKKEESPSKTTTTTTTTTTKGATIPKKQYALTKIHLTMEGNLRNDQELPPPHAIAEDIQATFLALNHSPPEMATATPSGHTLLLDPLEAGKVYINGRYVTTWGDDAKIGSHFPALFGMDLHSIPYWHGRIFDFDVLKRNYAQLWQEILIDAKLMPLNIGGRLLSRFISGKDPVKEDDDDDDDDDDDELMEDDDDEEEEEEEEEDDEGGEGTGATGGGTGSAGIKKPPPKRVDTGVDSLESQVMQSTKFDPVGISAKALATKFKMEYGDEGFPCLTHEIDWVKDRLPGRVPVAVPQRLINVLRRGGYFDTKRTSDEVWFSESRPAAEGMETDLVHQTVEYLKQAGCLDVHANMIVFFSGAGISDPVQKKGLVRFNRSMRQYHVNEHFLKMDLSSFMKQGMSMTSNNNDTGDDDDDDDDDEVPPSIPERAHLLGLHIAQEHQDGSVLLRYLLKHVKIAQDDNETKDEEKTQDNNKKRKI